MGDGLGDPIFALFVILMVLLFFLLLLKRLYRKPSPMEFQFESLTPPRQNHTGQIPTISVAVHVHDTNNPRPYRGTASQVELTTPPPSFESVVSQKPPSATAATTGTGGGAMSMASGVSGGQNNASFVDDQIPPPSYQEYLSLQKEGYRDEQGKF